MLVKLWNTYDDREVALHGTAHEVEQKLLAMFPHLYSGDPEHEGDLQGLLEMVDSMQAWSVEDVQLDDGESLHGPEDDPEYGGPPARVTREVFVQPDLLLDQMGPMHVGEPDDEE